MRYLSLKAVPYYAVGAITAFFLAFMGASQVVLMDMAKERTISALTINMSLSQITRIDIRDL